MTQDQDALIASLIEEWNSLQLALRHYSVVMTSVIEAWKQTQAELESANNRLAALTGVTVTAQNARVTGVTNGSQDNSGP